MADNDMWTIKAALDWTIGFLERKGDENPRLSAEWLMSEATGLSRIELYVNFERPLTLDERAILRDFVARRGKGEPLQLISGKVPFRYITVLVAPNVLIPRPETEVLVSEAFAEPITLPLAKMAKRLFLPNCLSFVLWTCAQGRDALPVRLLRNTQRRM